jgi:hypothetical protein
MKNDYKLILLMKFNDKTNVHSDTGGLRFDYDGSKDFTFIDNFFISLENTANLESLRTNIVGKDVGKPLFRN